MAATLKTLYQGSPLVQAAPQWQSPTAATTGGTIAASTTRYYVVTAVVNGVETLPSPETSATTGSGTATNAVNLYAQTVPGATSYRFFVSTTQGGTKQLLGTNTAPTYVDTGAAATATNPPATTTLVETTAAPGLYTPPNGKTGLALQLMISNPSGYAGTFSLSKVPAGGTGGPGNRIANAVPVGLDSVDGPVNESLFLPLQAGEFITGGVTVAGMVMTIVGLEQ